MAITNACAPGGAINMTINNACAPGGAINMTINNACAPGGAINMTINNAFEANDRKLDARWVNQNSHDSHSHVSIFARQDGQFPEGFPMTLQAFYSMNALQANALLAFYSLAGNGTLDEKRSRLARYLHLGNIIC